MIFLSKHEKRVAPFAKRFYDLWADVEDEWELLDSINNAKVES